MSARTPNDPDAGPAEIDAGKFDFQHALIEEQDGRKRLTLPARGKSAFCDQNGEEGIDFGRSPSLTDGVYLGKG